MAEAVKDLQHVLDLVADQLMTVPYWLTISGLCAICSTLADDVRDRYLLHFWLTFVVGWGGGLTSAIVLARPLDLPINMFCNRHDIMIVAIWWLANYFPGGLPGKILRTKPMRVLSLLLTQICRAGTMCLVMSLVAKYHPDSTIGVIVMGCVAGSGGKVICDMVRGGYNMMRDPDEISMPGMGLQSSMLASVAYYWLVLVQGVLSFRQGKALLVIFMALHVLVAELTGFNLMTPIASAVHTVTNVPQPMSLAAARKVTPAGSAVPSAISKKQQ